jgi:hypothetical protein
MNEDGEAYSMRFNESKVQIDWIIAILLIIISRILFVYYIYFAIYQFVLPFELYSFDVFTFQKVITFVVIAIISSILYRKGRVMLSRIKTFKLYVSILSADPTNSIGYIAASTDLPKVSFITSSYSNKNQFVQNCIVSMISKGYFQQGTYIDPIKNCVVFPDTSQLTGTSGSDKSIEYITFTCPSCGASNKAEKSIEIECEFCGTPYQPDSKANPVQSKKESGNVEPPS